MLAYMKILTFKTIRKVLIITSDGPIPELY